MKKNLVKSLGILLILSGCSSVNNAVDNFLYSTSSIPTSVSQKILDNVNSENELYSIGSANIERNGGLIAQSKAVSRAKEQLKDKIKKEVKIDFNSFLLSTDNYSKKIIKDVLPELSNYSVELILKTANKKSEWETEQSVYTLLVVKRDTITNISKQVFTDYLNDVSNKLNTLKTKVSEVNSATFNSTGKSTNKPNVDSASQLFDEEIPEEH